MLKKSVSYYPFYGKVPFLTSRLCWFCAGDYCEFVTSISSFERQCFWRLFYTPNSFYCSPDCWSFASVFMWAMLLLSFIISLFVYILDPDTLVVLFYLRSLFLFAFTCAADEFKFPWLFVVLFCESSKFDCLSPAEEPVTTLDVPLCWEFSRAVTALCAWIRLLLVIYCILLLLLVFY